VLDRDQTTNRIGQIVGISADELVTNLGALAAKVTRGSKVAPAEVAAAFGWRADHVRERKITVGEMVLDVGRGFLGAQPAALFATPLRRNGVDPLNGAALYGYHAAVRWGLLVEERGLTAFNLHWTVKDHWFAMPTVRWDAIDAEQAFLGAFSLKPWQRANWTGLH
jgi:hypothetical protein